MTEEREYWLQKRPQQQHACLARDITHFISGDRQQMYTHYVEDRYSGERRALLYRYLAKNALGPSTPTGLRVGSVGRKFTVQRPHGQKERLPRAGDLRSDPIARPERFAAARAR